LLACLSAHDFNACGYTGTLNHWGLMTPIGYWPLLQHIPDVISIELGGTSHPSRAHLLVVLGVAGVAGSVALARLVLARVGQSAWSWGFFFIVLSSPLITYARQTVGETLATGLLVCLVAVAVLQAPPPLVALAAFGAAVTKETSYPFVVAFGVLGLVLGLASWWTPFGWTSYGPRLSLPWLLPLVLLALVAYGEELGDLVRRLVTPRRNLIAVFALGLVLTLPHVGEMWRPNASAGF